MAKKKAAGRDLVMFSRRIPRELMLRFQAHADSLIPRASDTALLEAAMIEYLDRHEPKTKKGGER